ncbi:hypothetical protein BpHYR1_049919 [Brachionus plicatilis]|uniref:Uncharacterized protein n=1 Tax=Brachionus plicatilis TaxID=10195 RepID=A0A3M7S5M0_BRAPC|nr:hypothetical protein BpHYR1_049919 [Brachionus plicatilis]
MCKITFTILLWSFVVTCETHAFIFYKTVNHMDKINPIWKDVNRHNPNGDSDFNHHFDLSVWDNPSYKREASHADFNLNKWLSVSQC